MCVTNVLVMIVIAYHIISYHKHICKAPQAELQRRRAVSVCPSVRLSHSCILSKRKPVNIIFNFLTIGQPHHSSFSPPNVMAIFRQDSANEGVECRWGMQKSRFQNNSLLVECDKQLRRSTVQQLQQLAWTSIYRTDLHASLNLVYHSQRGRLRRVQNLIVHSGESEAEVTNNRILHSTFCTIDANS